MKKLPTPYWQSPDGAHVLYCADCLDVLPLLEPGSVDAVVADPPYGINHQCDFATRGRGQLAKSHDYTPITGDDKPFDPSQFLRWPAVLFGANYYADKLPPSSGWIVWDKRVREGVGVNDQSDAELAWTNCIKGVRVVRHMWNGFWRDSERGTAFHPMQKPVAVIRWILEWIEGNTILDPFAGSGTTAVACIRTGRRSISIEKEPKYCEIAKRRMEEAIGVGTLFDPRVIEQSHLFSDTILTTDTNSIE